MVRMVVTGIFGHEAWGMRHDPSSKLTQWMCVLGGSYCLVIHLHQQNKTQSPFHLNWFLSEQVKSNQVKLLTKTDRGEDSSFFVVGGTITSYHCRWGSGNSNSIWCCWCLPLKMLLLLLLLLLSMTTIILLCCQLQVLYRSVYYIHVCRYCCCFRIYLLFPGWLVSWPDINVYHLLFLYMSPSPSSSSVSISISTSTIVVTVTVASSSRYAAPSVVTDTTGTSVCLPHFLSSMLHLQYLDTFR